MSANINQQSDWFTSSVEDVCRSLKVDPAKGLSSSEVQERLKTVGANQLEEKKKEPGWQAFLRQYREFMQLVLLGAAIINLIVTGQWNTSLMLVILTIFNAFLGLRGEAKAEASLAALAGKMKSIARVRRDGEAKEIEVQQIVPGDVVLMEAGNLVPADGRLFVAATLEIEEAALTGESVASPKNTDPIPHEDAPLGDRHCMAFMNTSVTRGRGEMLVTATGMQTEMGHIADLLNKTEADKTPLQKQIDRLTLIIVGFAAVAFILMVILGLRNGQEFDAIFIAGVALAVAAIPTGLPAVITTMYSMGTSALAAKNAIVKRLPSVETLGSVSAICSDKTGTLTLNKMTAVEFIIPGHNRFKVTGDGYRTQGSYQLLPNSEPQQPWQKGRLSYNTNGQLLSAGGAPVDLHELMVAMALCADARLDDGDLIGDPTEGALIVLAEKGGISVDGAREMFPRIAEVPFDSDYKFMATFHNMNDEQGREVVRCFVKGAPDILIAKGSYYWRPGDQAVPMTEDNRHLALQENERIAQAGERVMVVARKDFDPLNFDPNSNLIEEIKNLTLMGMIGIVDPPRAEAKDAIAKCQNAGIQVRMITGDHAVTASAIGKQLGIEGRALTGAQFAEIPDQELKSQLDEIGVVARVSPQDKIRLVSLLQEQDNIVAMTGDGVNDAPALKKADIGVAMGVTGTEVSKGAAVMILTDDNFATIVTAVAYGRAIYNNLFNYVRYQMEQLVAYIACYLFAAYFFVLGGVPFSAKSVLFLNFLITVPVAIAIGLDKPPDSLMEQKPRPLKQPILSTAQWTRIILIGILAAVFVIYLEATFEAISPVTGATIGFVSFALISVAMGLSARREKGTAFNRDIIEDRTQLLLYGIAILITILSTELGFLQRILNLTSLSNTQWLLAIASAVLLLLVDEVIKFRLRRG